ncbi:MAG: LysR family transcriptional regulator [Pseudomonadales bacterium]
MDWDDFKFVQAVAQTGSVRAAGERLQVHGSTVARHLDQLEQRLGIRLFARTPRGMQITAAGAEVIDALDRVAAELEMVERSLRARGPAVAGPVVLAATPALSAELVVPQLGDLYREHPDLNLRVITEPPLEALQRGVADMALCLSDDPPDDLVGRPLGRIMACAYAATGHRPGDGGRWIGSADPASPSARVRLQHFPDLAPGTVVDDPALRAVALGAGLGVGLLPCYLGDVRPGLVRVGAADPVLQGEAWLFTRQDSRGVPRIQVLSAFLQSLFLQQRPRLEGRISDRVSRKDPE